MQTGAAEQECELYLGVQTGALHAKGPSVEGGGSYTLVHHASM